MINFRNGSHFGLVIGDNGPIGKVRGLKATIVMIIVTIFLLLPLFATIIFAAQVASLAR